MSDVAKVMVAGLTHEPLPSAIARHRHAFEGSGGAYALVIMPDGTSFLCKPNGEQMDSEHLDYDATIAKIAEIYGLKAFRGA